MTLEYVLFIGSALILLSIAIAKLSDNLGVPSLLLFLGIGMLAGSEGPGGIEFDDPRLAQSIGIIALVFILFAGGLDTRWSAVRRVAWQAASLSTIGVLLTALAVGVFVSAVLGFGLLEGLLLGAVISSTDAAAVFAVLRSRQVSLRENLQPLLELESGSNDPMAVFLTIGLIELITVPGTGFVRIASMFILQMGVGAAVGIVFGKAMVLLINRLKFSYDGIYPVYALASAGLMYSATTSIGGSGFLAVYLAGIVAGNSDFVQKKSLLRFFDGLAWLSQIAMFVTLGLLVFPSRILPVMGTGVLVAVFLIFIARPLSVFVSLALTRLDWREKAFLSWVGLRGAVPIILATFPLLANLPAAELLFNIVFFTVLTSALLQGWSIPIAARALGVDAPPGPSRRYPLETAPMEGVDTDLVDLIVPYHSAVIGKSIVELGMPPDSLVVLISRNDEFIVPSGGSILQEGDTLLVIVNKENLPAVRRILSEQREEE